MAETANDKPKSGETYTDEVTFPTKSFNVEKPSTIEEASKAFVMAAKANGVTLDGDPTYLGCDQRVGFSATYKFEGTVK